MATSTPLPGKEVSNPDDTFFLQEIGSCITELSKRNNFGVAQLADMLHLSPQQLNRKLQSLAGVAPGKLLSDYRIGYAKQLLLESDATIKLIASKCGFNNHASFNKCFFKHFQCSPSQFREKNNTGNYGVQVEPQTVESLSGLKILLQTESCLLEIAKIVLANIDDEKLTVASLAQKLCMSPSTLNRHLKKAYALTPRVLIKKLRLLYACELLARKRGTLTDVAYRSGFFDPAHLTHSFKAIFGYPPSDFNKKYDGELSLSWITGYADSKG